MTLTEEQFKTVGFNKKFYPYTSEVLQELNSELEKRLEGVRPKTLEWFKTANSFHKQAKNWVAQHRGKYRKVLR